VGAEVTVDGPTVVVIGAGYEGKRHYYERLAGLGARLVIVDEPGHWSEWLVDQIAGTQWLATPSGDPDVDAGAILDALQRAGVHADGVLTFWENWVRPGAPAAGRHRVPRLHLRVHVLDRTARPGACKIETLA
jgi:hypothetical protein